MNKQKPRDTPEIVVPKWYELVARKQGEICYTVKLS